MIVSVLGIYLAADPELYLRGVIRLVPVGKRAGARDLLETLGHTLRWWMVGQLISMTAVGLLSYIGLRLLGVPLALILAVVAFLLTFIPFIGPLLSAIPVVLVAFSQSPTMALYTLLLYTAIQMLEGYVLTPNVQRRSVSLPPALTLPRRSCSGSWSVRWGSPWRRPSPPPGWSRSTGSMSRKCWKTASRTRPRAAAD